MYSGLLYYTVSSFFFFNDTATTEIYTLSLHDALPISGRPARRGRGTVRQGRPGVRGLSGGGGRRCRPGGAGAGRVRSEEHTSELQSRLHLVCRLLLEKKKKKKNRRMNTLSKKNDETCC